MEISDWPLGHRSLSSHSLHVSKGLILSCQFLIIADNTTATKILLVSVGSSLVEHSHFPTLHQLIIVSLGSKSISMYSSRTFLLTLENFLVSLAGRVLFG